MRKDGCDRMSVSSTGLHWNRGQGSEVKGQRSLAGVKTHLHTKMEDGFLCNAITWKQPEG